MLYESEITQIANSKYTFASISFELSERGQCVTWTLLITSANLLKLHAVVAMFRGKCCRGGDEDAIVHSFIHWFSA